MTGWTIGTLLFLLAMEVSAQPVPAGASTLPIESQPLQRPLHADFRPEFASANAHDLADWVVQTDDNQGLPFVLVDKIQARAFVFSSRGQLKGATPVLLGLARGDDGVPGIGDRPLSRILPMERTTPSGRFLASIGRNLSDQDILWVDYIQGISLHPVRSADPRERRLQRLASPSVEDKRISYGCINVPTAFWLEVVLPTFMDMPGIVYVLPETRPLQSVFSLKGFLHQ